MIEADSLEPVRTTVRETARATSGVGMDDGESATMRDVTLAAGKVVRADRATCYVISDDGRIDAVHTTAEHPRQRALIEGARGRTADQLPIWQILVEQRGPLLVVEAADQLPAPARGIAERLGVGAFIGARLEHDSVRQEHGPTFLGALFCSSRAPRRFTEEERAGMRGLASLASLALANARLQEEALRAVTAREVAERAVREVAEEQAALRRVASAVARGGAAEEIFALVAEEVARLLHCEHGIVAELDRDRALVVGDWFAPSAGELGTPRLRIASCIDALAAQVRRSEHGARVRTEPGAAPGCGAGAGGAVGVPVTVRGALWGMVAVATARPEPLARDAEDRLNGFAELVSLSLASAQWNAERERLESRLRRGQRLEAVGRLAAGLVHEIATPIQFAGDSVAFLRDALSDLEALIGRYRAVVADAEGGVPPRMLEEVTAAEAEADLAFIDENLQPAIARTLEGVDRVIEIVRAMKEFVRPPADEQAPADVNRAILRTITVARNELKYVAEVETDLGPLPPVVCHLADLHQVVLNLLTNAARAVADAAAQRGTAAHGRIRVSTRECDGEVTISVADNGCGIPEAIRSRIFDPLVATEGPGRGIGRGLAMARYIVVEKHGGSLGCETELGRGTTFHVRLPVDGRRTEAAGAGG